MQRHNESYRKSDSFALNQKDIMIFLKNLLAQNAVSQSILTKFCTIRSSVFFSLFSTLGTFSLLY